jgi:hypothetical protein
MAVEITGPGHCVECGIEITEHTLGGPLVFTIEGHELEVPGLYQCQHCKRAMTDGELESTVTREAATEYLVETFLPNVAATAELAKARLDKAASVAEILCLTILADLMDEAADDPEMAAAFS